MSSTPGKSDSAPGVLIASLSGRALAACARRGGYRPLVADLFGDLDTRDAAEAWERVPGSLGYGFDPPALLGALDRLAAGRAVIGVVTGTGFEDRPAVLRALAQRHTLLGNPPDIVTAMKDPVSFAALCARAGMPHPEISHALPEEGAWLRKRIGGMGGAHIVAAPSRPLAGAGEYYQCRVAGEPISAAFLAAGGACRILAFTRQWADPGSRRPFRYGGAVRPALLPPGRAAEISAALARLVALTELRGLNSADFLVRPDGFDLLEINPRPGATLEILADRDGTLFRMHIDACAGNLPDAASPLIWPRAAAAAAIVYARTGLTIPADFVWPDWSTDRRPPATAIARGLPLCGVWAEADDAQSAENLVRDRGADILARLG
jgi:predicted ATP-grasp superfamily ATP-dependent carboligase